MRDPRNPREWQEAVNLAMLFRAIHDCCLYGLIEKVPGINVRRCDLILDCGRAVGYKPNKTIEQLLRECQSRTAP